MATQITTPEVPSHVHHLAKKPLPEFDAHNLLAIALENNAAIDVIERLAALQEKILGREAEIAFNSALSRIQAEVKRVAPDLTNSQTMGSRYASYAALDRVIRPIYTREGMSLSFSHGDSLKPDHVRVLCFASLGAYTRSYQIDMPADGKGAKGGDVMTKTHAVAAADSYAKRYLVKDIFNIAIGEDDDDGNCNTASGSRIPADRVKDFAEKIAKAPTLDKLKEVYFEAYREAYEWGDQSAQQTYMRAKDDRRKEMARGNR